MDTLMNSSYQLNTWSVNMASKPSIKEIEEYMAGYNMGSPVLPDTIPSAVNTKGLKHDVGKLQWSLMPFGALQEVVKVLEFGSKKYAPNNWKYVDNAEERYWNAAMRHLIAYKTESATDSETGLSHLAHATCCLLFLQHLNNENNTK